MKKLILSALIVVFLVVGAQAAVRIGGVTPDVIFGSGNVNEAWTVYTGFNGLFVEDVEIGQRAKLGNENTYNMEPTGYYYYHQTGSPDGTAANWDFNFSANVDVQNAGVRNLANTRIELSIEVTPPSGISSISYYDVLADLTGNEVGTGSTPNGGGLLYPTESGMDLSAYTVVQNSINIGELGVGFDVNAEATYDFVMSVYDPTNPTAVKVCHSWMQVQVSKVPEPAALLVLLQLGVVALAVRRRKR